MSISEEPSICPFISQGDDIKECREECELYDHSHTSCIIFWALSKLADGEIEIFTRRVT